MTRKLLLILSFMLLCGASLIAGVEDSRWPIEGTIDLSSGFGDYRESRFHAGIDLRTGGRTGKRVVAPVDGYVSRLKTSYTGYGRGLYFKGNDGYIYVFGHLSKYFPELEKRMIQLQVEAKRYYLDQSFPADSIPVKKGELLAYSGETGAGAPHLHFEKRTADNVPLNPLTHGYSLSDKTPPRFTEIGFQLTDDRSLLPNGYREIFLPVTGSGSSYRLDTVLYLNSPFGVLANCYDMMNPDGMRQAVYKLSWYVDDTLYYQVVLDTLRYEQSDAAKLEYDFFQATEGEKRVRRLFSKYSNQFSGSGSGRIGKGVYGLEQEPVGLKRGLVVAEDAFGNSARLAFSFVWGPPHALFTIDSTVVRLPDTTRFYFSPRFPAGSLEIDSLFLLLMRDNVWGTTTNQSKMTRDGDKLKIEVVAAQTGRAVLRLAVALKGGVLVPDTLFNGIGTQPTIQPHLTHEIVDGGMLVSINTKPTLPSLSRFVIYNGAESLGTVIPYYYSTARQTAFIPASRQYEHISRIGIAPLDPKATPTYFHDSLIVEALGVRPSQVFSLDNRCQVLVKEENMYAPQFAEFTATRLLMGGRGGVLSDHYEALPETMLTRTPFEIQLKLLPDHPANPHTGLCWLDKKKDKWVWLAGDPKSDMLTAKSNGGGSFAAVLDVDPPRITVYGIRDTMTYSDPNPKITFRVQDELSDVEDDRNFLVKMNGQWVPVEYDMEKGMATVMLPWPLKDGEQHLAINVTDRAGNLAERYMRFFIKTSAKKGN